jgi:hypothetical protein
LSQRIADHVRCKEAKSENLVARFVRVLFPRCDFGNLVSHDLRRIGRWFK